MIKTKVVLTSMVLATAVLNLAGQQTIQAGLDRTPLLQGNGDVSGYPRDQHVFYDPTTFEYIVLIRDSEGKVERTLRAARHNSVYPTITSRVSRDPDGTFHYRYEVSNGPTAPMAIKSWSLAIFAHIDKTRVVASSWPGGPVNERLPGISRDDHRVLRWQSPAGAPLLPGATVRDFEVVSNLAPGFILAAFSGEARGHELTEEEWASLPKAAADHLKVSMGAAWDTRTASLLGPCFAPGADYAAVASNFSFGAKIFLNSAVDRAFSSQVQSLLDESIRSSSSLAPSDSRFSGLRATSRDNSQIYLSALELTLNAIGQR